MTIREIQKTIQDVVSGEPLFLFVDEITDEVARYGFKRADIEACYAFMLAHEYLLPCDDDKSLPAYIMGKPLDD